jgi:hypothetical protein
LAKVYIMGISDGMNWVIARDVAEDRTPAYCAPKGISLTVENYIEILNRKINAWENSPPARDQAGDVLIGVLLLKGLEETFPCPAKP